MSGNGVAFRELQMQGSERRDKAEIGHDHELCWQAESAPRLQSRIDGPERDAGTQVSSSLLQ